LLKFFFFMKKFFAILGILIVLFAGSIWFIYFRGGRKHPKGPKPISLTVSKHSDVFNLSVASLLNDYYSLSESFVNADTNAVNTSARALKTSLDSMKIDELKVDTTGIYESALDPLANARSAVDSIIGNAGIAGKRVFFNTLSENLRLLFIVVKYDQGKLYWQECPMAFGEDKPGNWLSKTDAVRNPYLGNKNGMLECGAPKDTINFMLKDSLR
jgi:Protein of unknown function (DUF3347)